MRTGLVVVLLLTSVPALAGGGFAVEGGAGLVTRGLGADVGLTGRIPLPGQGRLEVRTRGFFSFGNEFHQVFQGLTLGARYRTPEWEEPVSFTFAVGGGLVVWTSCIVGDFCGGLGPFAELSPTLSFRVAGPVLPFIALTGAVGFVVGGNPSFWLTAGVTVGVAFDFTPPKPLPAPEQAPASEAPVPPPPL